MNNIKLILVGGLIVCFFLIHNYSLSSENLNQLAMSYDKAEIFAEAVIYMIDLDLEWGEVIELQALNQDYVACFNKVYLTKFLADRPSYLFFLETFESKEEAQFIEYKNNKNLHNALTQEELTLLDEYNNFCDEYHEILDYNDYILSMIAKKEQMSLEGLKEMRLNTQNSYEKTIYGDEEYSHLLKSQPEMSQKLQDFKNKYFGVYPFNYEVDLPWDYKFTTSQYDASLYEFYYQDVTEDFYVIYPYNSDNYGVFFKNKYRLNSYTVYNDCIEISFSSQDGNMSAIISIIDGVIFNIYAYIQENKISAR